MSELFKDTKNFWIKNTRKALCYDHRSELSKLGAYWCPNKRHWKIEKIHHKGHIYSLIEKMGLKLVKAES